jgi:nitronate monooxygenase
VRAAVELPVLAAGGLSTGADLVAALALGAEGVVLGTALMAAEESFAHRYHKQRLLAAVARDTLLTDIFHINWPRGARVRVLSSAVTVGGRGRDVEGARIPIGDEDGRPIYLFSTDSPLRCTTGDLESMALYAGTGVGNIVSIRSAASIIDDIMAEAGRLHEAAGAGARAMQASSPVCYAGEMGGDYMGELAPDALAAELGPLLGEVIAMLARRPPRDRAAPPFTRELLNLAPSLLGLASHAGRTVRPLADTDPAPGAVEGRIGLLSTRVAEGALRHALVTLRAAVERLAGSGRQLVERRTEEA